LTFLAAGLVIIYGLMHSAWNLFAKKSRHKGTFLWLCHLAAVLLFLPFAAPQTSSALTEPRIICLLAISLFMHGACSDLLVTAYTSGDLSRMYPALRGTSSLLLPLVGIVFLQERLSAAGWMGVLLIISGIIMLHEHTMAEDVRTRKKITWLPWIIAACITVYTVVDKMLLETLSPVLLIEAVNIGNLFALTLMIINRAVVSGEWRINRRTVLLGGLMIPGGYLIFLFALSKGNSFFRFFGEKGESGQDPATVFYMRPLSHFTATICA
jgi:uncharacterized membrane protein